MTFQPVGTAAVNFGYQSGDYDVELIIGDAVISNPFRFNVGTVTLKFPEMTAMEGTDKNTSYKQKPNVYTTKPEIKVIPSYTRPSVYKIRQCSLVAEIFWWFCHLQNIGRGMCQSYLFQI